MIPFHPWRSPSHRSPGDDINLSRIFRDTQQADVTDSIALVDLEPGDLLGPSVLTSAPEKLDGERLVGAVVRAGRYPEEIRQGDSALAVPTYVDGEDPPGIVVPVRVLRVSVSLTNELSVTLAVVEDETDRITKWAAQDSLALATTPIGGRSVSVVAVGTWRGNRRHHGCAGHGSCSRHVRPAGMAG